MTLHFSESEYEARREKAIAAMNARGLDGMLLLRPESMYYLTGFDTAGYVFFQVLYFGADGRLSLLTRSPDLRQAALTSIIKDVRIWVDSDEADPVEELKRLLDEFGCRGSRLGIEGNAPCLNGVVWDQMEAAFESFCVLEEATDLVNRLRLVKSEAELAYVRKAGALADAALAEGNRLAVPGAFEGDIQAAMQGVIFRGGGDYPNGGMVIGSGAGAVLCRNHAIRRHLDPVDQLQLEFGAAYRHYHCCLMRTVLTGKATDYQRHLHAAGVEALDAAQDAAKPGNIVGDIFDAHARVLDAAGLKEHRLNACGYSLGATFNPSWMDYPMLFTQHDVVIEPNMVFFMHMIILDSDRGVTMCPGETSVITASGAERLSKMPRDLIVN